MRIVRAAFVAALLLSSQVQAVAADAAERCLNSGYETVVGTADLGNLIFDTAAECIRYVNAGGTLIEAIPIPAGATATFDDPTLTSCNALTWGWGGQGAVGFFDSKPAGCGTLVGPDATLGPFLVDAAFVVVLKDDSCGEVLFGSEGDHGAETYLGGGEWIVDITDAGPACEFATVAREPTGPGNLRVRVVVNQPPGNAGGNSGASAACEDGGYLDYTDAGGNSFRNEGACVRYAAQGGVLVTAVPASPFSVAFQFVAPDGLNVVVSGSGLEPLSPVDVVLNDVGGGVAASGQADANGDVSLSLDSACGADLVSLTATGTPDGGVETTYQLPLPGPSICPSP